MIYIKIQIYHLFIYVRADDQEKENDHLVFYIFLLFKLYCQKKENNQSNNMPT